jgi:hypothetical protein
MNLLREKIIHGRTKFFLYRWNLRFHHVEKEKPEVCLVYGTT